MGGCISSVRERDRDTSGSQADGVLGAGAPPGGELWRHNLAAHASPAAAAAVERLPQSAQKLQAEEATPGDAEHLQAFYGRLMHVQGSPLEQVRCTADILADHFKFPLVCVLGLSESRQTCTPLAAAGPCADAVSLYIPTCLPDADCLGGELTPHSTPPHSSPYAASGPAGPCLTPRSGLPMDWASLRQSHGLFSFLAAPINVGPDVIGVLALAHHEPSFFDAPEWKTHVKMFATFLGRAFLEPGLLTQYCALLENLMSCESLNCLVKAVRRSMHCLLAQKLHHTSVQCCVAFLKQEEQPQQCPVPQDQHGSGSDSKLAADPRSGGGRPIHSLGAVDANAGTSGAAGVAPVPSCAVMCEERWPAAAAPRTPSVGGARDSRSGSGGVPAAVAASTGSRRSSTRPPSSSAATAPSRRGSVLQQQAVDAAHALLQGQGQGQGQHAAAAPVPAPSHGGPATAHAPWPLARLSKPSSFRSRSGTHEDLEASVHHSTGTPWHLSLRNLPTLADSPGADEAARPPPSGGRPRARRNISTGNLLRRGLHRGVSAGLGHSGGPTLLGGGRLPLVPLALRKSPQQIGREGASSAPPGSATPAAAAGQGQGLGITDKSSPLAAVAREEADASGGGDGGSTHSGSGPSMGAAAPARWHSLKSTWSGAAVAPPAWLCSGSASKLGHAGAEGTAGPSGLTSPPPTQCASHVSSLLEELGLFEASPLAVEGQFFQLQNSLIGTAIANHSGLWLSDCMSVLQDVSHAPVDLLLAAGAASDHPPACLVLATMYRPGTEAPLLAVYLSSEFKYAPATLELLLASLSEALSVMAPLVTAQLEGQLEGEWSFLQREVLTPGKNLEAPGVPTEGAGAGAKRAAEGRVHGGPIGGVAREAGSAALPSPLVPTGTDARLGGKRSPYQQQRSLVGSGCRPGCLESQLLQDVLFPLQQQQQQSSAAHRSSPRAASAPLGMHRLDAATAAATTAPGQQQQQQHRAGSATAAAAVSPLPQQGSAVSAAPSDEASGEFAAFNSQRYTHQRYVEQRSNGGKASPRPVIYQCLAGEEDGEEEGKAEGVPVGVLAEAAAAAASAAAQCSGAGTSVSISLRLQELARMSAAHDTAMHRSLDGTPPGAGAIWRGDAVAAGLRRSSSEDGELGFVGSLGGWSMEPRGGAGGAHGSPQQQEPPWSLRPPAPLGFGKHGDSSEAAERERDSEESSASRKTPVLTSPRVPRPEAAAGEAATAATAVAPPPALTSQMRGSGAAPDALVPNQRRRASLPPSMATEQARGAANRASPASAHHHQQPYQLRSATTDFGPHSPRGGAGSASGWDAALAQSQLRKGLSFSVAPLTGYGSNRRHLSALITSFQDRVHQAQRQQLQQAMGDRQHDLDELTIKRLVGIGGFGSVYLGTYQGSEVAVKVIIERSKANVFDNATELAVLSTLSHPSIVQVITFFTDVVVSRPSPELAAAAAAATAMAAAGGTPSAHAPLPPLFLRHSSSVPFCLERLNQHSPSDPLSQRAQHRASQERAVVVLMEYCDGGSLAEAVERGVFWTGHGALPAAATDLRPGPLVDRLSEPLMGQLSGAQLRWLAIYQTLLEIAAALRYLHSLSLVHRDVKLQNVLLKTSTTDPRGFTCKLTDFGLVRLAAPPPQPLLASAVSSRPHSSVLPSPSGPALSGTTPGTSHLPFATTTLLPLSAASTAAAAGTAAAAAAALPLPSRRGGGGKKRRYSGTISHLPPEMFCAAAADVGPPDGVGDASELQGEHAGSDSQQQRQRRPVSGACTAAAPTTAQDIYAFGILMWEVATGEQLYRGIGSDELVKRVLLGARPRFGADTPPQYVQLAERCWHANPALRPGADELLGALSKEVAALRNSTAAAATAAPTASTAFSPQQHLRPLYQHPARLAAGHVGGGYHPLLHHGVGVGGVGYLPQQQQQQEPYDETFGFPIHIL